MMIDELLTPAQVAALLQVKAQTVRDAAARGALPCVRVWSGKRKTLLRFRKLDLLRFLEERSRPTDASTER
jgi:excisionase family DNA binding protein